MDRDNVLTEDAHHQNHQQQQPFHHTRSRFRAAAVQFAHHRAGKLLRQARMGNRHSERPQHRIRQRNFRPAGQTVLKHGDNTRLRHLARRIGHIGQRHPRQQPAGKRTDGQTQHHMHPSQRQRQHHDYSNHNGIHAFSPFGYNPSVSDGIKGRLKNVNKGTS